MTRPTSKTALVIGATGGIGGAAAAALRRHGWRVRALHRDPDAARTRRPDLAGLDWIAGDAMDAGDVAQAAEGVDLLFHGANPPGYRNWRGLALPMLANAIAAADEARARLVFPGNLYNYGPDAGARVDEHAPQTPTTRKGRIRVEMEAMLRDAAGRGARVMIVRAADYFGGHAPGSWFETVLVKPGKPVRSVTYPGDHEVGHAWAYLPDLAETIARLADREAELGAFETFHFAGHEFDRGVEMAQAIRAAAGAPAAPIRRFPWWLTTLAAPFDETLRELREMRYLWQRPLSLDNAKLVRFLGAEPHTPLDQAVSETLAGLGCLDARVVSSTTAKSLVPSPLEAEG